MSLIERLAGLRRLALPSMLSPRALRVHVGPQQLLCAVTRGGHLVDQSSRQVVVANSGSDWQPGLDALGRLLHASRQDPATAGLPLEVSLSGRWCQMALAPWSDALLSDAGAQRFLQTQLAALYGEPARSWSVISDDAPYGQPRLVCGIDAALLQAVQDVAAEAGRRCLAIEPVLGVVRRALAGAGASAQALAVIEAQRITLAALAGGRVAALQIQALPANGAWRAELPQAWQRWTLRAPELADLEHVAVVDLSGAPLSPAAHPHHGLQLVPDTLPARFRLAASPFGDAPGPGGYVPLHAHAPAPSSGEAATPPSQELA